MHKIFSHLRGIMYYQFFGDGCSVYEIDNSSEFDNDCGKGYGDGDWCGDGRVLGRNFGDGRGVASEFDYGDTEGDGRNYLRCLLLEERQVK